MEYEAQRKSPNLDGVSLADLLGPLADVVADRICKVTSYLLRRTYGSNHFIMSRQEDVVQEVLLSVTRQAILIAEGKRDSIEHLDAWLCRVTVNAALRTWRNERIARNSANLDSMAEITEPDPVSHDRRMGLRNALAALDPPCRELLIRYEVVGESRSEIATALGVTSNALGVRLHRCREKLREKVL